MKDPTQRFWSGVKIGLESECWPWTRARQKDAKGKPTYGRTSFKDAKAVMAHRLSWILSKGPIPDGLFVCHRCDNPPCCNPSHLFLGTREENMQDASKKNRLSKTHQLKGEDHPMARITAIDVERIRRECDGTRNERLKFCKEYGLTQVHVGRILLGQTWKTAGGKVRGSVLRDFSKDEVRAVRAMVAAGETQQSVADRFGVRQSVISRMVNRKSHAGVL